MPIRSHRPLSLIPLNFGYLIITEIIVFDQIGYALDVAAPLRETLG